MSWARGSRSSDSDAQFRLTDITLRFPKGELSIVTGETGSGKRLLLHAALGEAHVTSGTVVSPLQQPNTVNGSGSLALVSHSPWLENATIKDNILFGNVYNAVRYQEALYACALEPDLKSLRDGDMTMVGPKGVSLSGGQRSRVALARALYSDATTIIMGDILSAVDIHIRYWLVDKALCGPLSLHRTRILATHHVGLCRLPAAYIVHLSRGTVDKIEQLTPRSLQSMLFPEPESAESLEQPYGKGHSKDEAPKKQPSENLTDHGILTTFKQYFAYSGGAASWILVISIILLCDFLSIRKDWWLQQGTRRPAASECVTTSEAAITCSESAVPSAPQFTVVYIMLTLDYCLGLGIRCFGLYMIGFKASNTLFSAMTDSVLQATLEWIDITPRGHILTRFTTDMKTIDLRLPHDVGYLVDCLLKVAARLSAM